MMTPGLIWNEYMCESFVIFIVTWSFSCFMSSDGNDYTSYMSVNVILALSLSLFLSMWDKKSRIPGLVWNKCVNHLSFSCWPWPFSGFHVQCWLWLYLITPSPPSILWLVTSGASNKNCPYCQTETTRCSISQREMERKFVYTLETASNKEKHTWEKFEVDNAAKTSHLCVKSSFDCCGLFLWIPVLNPSYNLKCCDTGKNVWCSVHLQL